MLPRTLERCDLAAGGSQTMKARIRLDQAVQAYFVFVYAKVEALE